MAEPEPEPAATADLTDLLDWFRGAEGCKLGSLEVAQYEYEGRGLRATADIKKGNPLLCCPLRLVFSARAARAEPTLGPVFEQLSLRDDDMLALYLLSERRKGAASAHAAHIASLPTSYDQTIFWSEDEMAEIAGSNVFTLTQQLREQVRGDYDALQSALAPFEAIGAAEYSYDDYCWAIASIWSRSMDLPIPAADGEGVPTLLRVIGPVADMLNTQAAASSSHGYDAESDTLTIAASADAAAGDQLFISYGEVSNARSLWLYGFTTEDNKHDTVTLYTSMDTAAPSYSKRLKLLSAVGVEHEVLETCARSAHELSIAEPLPAALLLSLRVQHAPKKLFRLWRDDPEGLKSATVPPDAELERGILEALRAGIVGMLEGYSTSLEEDEAAWERWAPHTQTLAAVSGHRRRMALLLRLGEKRILRASIRAIDTAFNALNFAPAELDEAD